MNGNDEKSIISVDADTINGECGGQGNNAASGLNSKRSTSIKIDSIWIDLGVIKEKDDEKCRHFSIRGYVAKMREKGRRNLLPYAEQLPPIDVPNFKQWICQRCLWNCETENTALTSVRNPSIVRPSAKSNSQQDRNGVTIRPFGEGPSGVKRVDNENDDKNILAALGVNNDQSLQEIPDKAAVFQEPFTEFVSDDESNVAIETTPHVSSEKTSNGSREQENLEKAIAITTVVDQNDCSNEPPRRKARKVRLLKELLSGNTENPQQKNENSALRLGPRSSSPPEASPQIKRKIPHDQNHDQRSVDIITAQGHFGKKTKSSKVNVVPKSNMVEHRRDPEAQETGDDANKHQCHKHRTQRSSVLDHNIGTDRMTSWRSIFNDMERLDDQITAADGVLRPTHDISNGRGTEPDSNLPAPPPPDKTVRRAKKTSSLPHKSKLFEEGSKKINVDGCRAEDNQSDTELALGLSLNHNPQPQVHPRSSIPDRTPGRGRSSKPGFFLGESSIACRNSSDLKSTERCIHDVGNRCVHGTMILQDQRPYTQLPYGSCSGHRKWDFSDPYKRNTGVRLYSDVKRPHTHERQANMFPIGRSDEWEIAELMAKNQYERSLYYPPVRSNKNRITPDPSGFPNIITETPSFHPEYLSMIRPSSSSIPTISMMPMSESAGPTVIRNPGVGSFHRDRVSNFMMFDAFPQHQKQPSSGVWISDSGTLRHHDHDKKTPDKNVVEPFSPYHNRPTVPFGQEHVKRSNNDKGKNVIDLDLNLGAPNVIDVQSDSDSEPLDFTSREYPNEAIPAMQLLSLMDAGKPTYPFTDPKKLTNRSLSMARKPNPISNYCCPCSTHFRSARDGSSFRKEDRNGRVSLSAHRAIVPRLDPTETTVCSLNRNPADFSIPGPKNQYMIHHEDLKFRWEGCYKWKSAFENPIGPKRHKRA